MKLLLFRYRILISIIGLSIIYLYTLDNYWKPFWDSAIYISLAKSLAAGSGYSYMGLPHAKYPFMFPLLLSPIVGLFGLNFLLMRLLTVILAIASIFLTYILFRKLTDEGTAFAVMLLTGFSSVLLHLSTWILSEVPYMFFSLGTLCLFIDYSKEKRGFTKTGLLVPLLLLATIFTRTIGITLAVAVLLDLLLRSGAKGCFTPNAKKMVLIGIIISLPLSLWLYRSHLINRQFPFQPEYRGVLNYGREFFVKVPDNIHSESISYKDFIERIRGNARIYAHTLSTVIINKDPLSTTLRLCATLFFLYGFLWCVVKRRTVIEYYFSLYLIVCIAWWFNLHSARFVSPVIPCVFYYFITGLKRGLKLLSYRAQKGVGNRFEMLKRPAFVLVVFLLIITNFSFNPGVIQAERKKHFYPPEQVVEFDSAVTWITEHTAPNTVIMTSEAPWVFMRSGRKTLTFPLFEPISYIIDSILKHRVEYILVSAIHYETYTLMESLTAGHPEAFIPVFNNNKTFIYKIDPEALAILKDDLNKNLL